MAVPGSKPIVVTKKSLVPPTPSKVVKVHRPGKNIKIPRRR